jgi:hypothetical protein
MAWLLRLELTTGHGIAKGTEYNVRCGQDAVKVVITVAHGYRKRERRCKANKNCRDQGPRDGRGCVATLLREMDDSIKSRVNEVGVHETGEKDDCV